MKRNVPIHNLYNGVSQQPIVNRLPSQCEEQVNGWSSVIDGLSPRPPTQQVAVIQNFTDNAIYHYHTTGDEEFTVVYDVGVFTIIDSLGNTRAVTGDMSYLNGASSIGFLSLADSIFVVNQDKIVEAGTTKSPTNDYRYLINVLLAETNSTYEITFTLPNSSTHVMTTTLDEGVRPSGKVAKALTDSAKVALLTDGITAEHKGSAIEIESPVPLTITNTGTTDTHLRIITGETGATTDLPRGVDSRFTVKITGADNRDADDFYLKPTEDGSQVWEETVAPNTVLDINASTMPHILRLQGDGSFTFGEHTWADRTVGDADSNPMPSFVGSSIQRIFYFRNRLGFTSGENLILSEAGNYGNFFKNTVRTLLDSAVIDVAASISTDTVSDLEQVVAFNKTLLLFAKDNTQFQLDTQGALTPTNISINEASAFAADTTVKPIKVGHRVYFSSYDGAYSDVLEYYVSENGENNDASKVNGHAPRYIKGRVKQIEASVTDNAIFCLTEDDPNILYVNQFFWQGQEKVQNAWHKWVFDGDIKHLSVEESKLHLVINEAGVTRLLRLELNDDETVAIYQYALNLDNRRVFKNGDTFTALADGEIAISSTGRNLGNSQSRIELAVQTGDVYIGKPYEFTYEFSEQTVKNPKTQKSILGGRYQLHYLRLYYTESISFDVEVHNEGRDVFVEKFRGKVLGSGSSIIGRLEASDGVLTVPIYGNSKNVRLIIKSKSYLPSRFTSAEIEGLFTKRS